MRQPRLSHILDQKISQLTPGTEVTILAGEGTPPANNDRVDIIWSVRGCTALTAAGVLLSSKNLSDLILTDRHFDRFPVSEDAKHIQRLAVELVDRLESEFDENQVELENFDSEPE